MLKFSGHIFPSFFFEILLHAFPFYCNIFIFVVICICCFKFFFSMFEIFFHNINIVCLFHHLLITTTNGGNVLFSTFYYLFLYFFVIASNIDNVLFSLTSLLITFIVPCCKGFFVQLSSFFITSLHVLFECIIVIWHLLFFYHLIFKCSFIWLDFVIVHLFSFMWSFHLLQHFTNFVLLWFFVCFIINVCYNFAILC
jgi:hypothetical protein